MTSILLLDDEPNVLSALRRTLRMALGHGARIATFTDPHDALHCLGTAEFDVVVSDFRMPVMDGIQFLRFAREISPGSVRMVVSASTEINGVMSAINDVGVFRYIVKPWATDLLIEDVRAALAQAATAREERSLAAEMRLSSGQIDGDEIERRRLEELEPGLTQVNWGPNGEVLMPTMPARLS